MRYAHATIVRRSRVGLIAPMLIFVGLLVALYAIKAQTLEAKSRVYTLERSLAHERQVVQILSAEIAHLESPERLRALAVDQLGLQPTPTQRTMTLKQATQELAQKVEGQR